MYGSLYNATVNEWSTRAYLFTLELRLLPCSASTVRLSTVGLLLW